jgi:hypothetical protein
MNRRKLKENRHKLPLAYVSVFWSLVTLLFLSCVPASAEWVAVENDYLLPGLQTVYIDPDTIHSEGNRVTMRQLNNFKWMQGSARGPTRFLFTETHKQFDCMEKRLQLLAVEKRWPTLPFPSPLWILPFLCLQLPEDA